MSNQNRSHRSPDSQGYSNRQSDDFGTQDRPRASFSMSGEDNDEFGRAPQGYAGRPQEFEAGHGSGSGRGYGRQASQGWDQDYGFGGRQSSEFGGRGGYTSQGYGQSNYGRPGGMREEGGWDASPSRSSRNEYSHGHDRSREFAGSDRSRQFGESYRTQSEYGGREGQGYDAYGRGEYGEHASRGHYGAEPDRGGFRGEPRGRQGFDQPDRGGWDGGQSGYGQRGGMGYGEPGGMGYGEVRGRSNYGSQGGQSMYNQGGRGGYESDYGDPRAGRSGWEGQWNSSEDRHIQGGNRMYGDSQQRGHADNRPRSNYQQQQAWGPQRESQGSFSRGRERNRGREFGSPEDNRGGWQQTGLHSGRGPKGWRRSDERVTEDLCEALTRHPEIDATDIEVRVEKGEVTLSGTVDSREAKRYAEELAERCSGVTDVTNQLRVKRDDRSGESRGSMSKSGKQEVTATIGSHGGNGQSGRQESRQDTKPTANAGSDVNGKSTAKD